MENLLHISNETSTQETQKLLATLWDNRKTFVLLPQKLKGQMTGIQESLKLLPREFHKDHFILLTSGTTGQPRLVVGSKARSLKLVEILHQAQSSSKIENTIGILPLSYSFGFINQWLWAKHFKVNFIPADGFSNPSEIIDLLTNKSNSMICMISAHIELLQRTFNRNSCFPLVKRIHFAGSKFPQYALSFLSKVFPEAEVFNNYGCVEAMPRLSIRRSHDSEDDANIGKPLPGVQLHVDADQRLMFKSPYSAIAVIDSHKVISINEDTWTQTGDLGILEEDGSWRLLGRKSTIFKRYGEKISLQEVEASIRTVWTRDLTTYRTKDRHGEEGYVLVLSPKPSESDIVNILQNIRSSWSRPLWPLSLTSIAEMPKLPSGKIDITALTNTVDKIVHWKQRI